MAHVQKQIEIDVPVSTVYNQWTRFEKFPSIMDGVHEVRHIDERRLWWDAEVGFRRKQWEAEICQQVPDRIITWRATDGSENAGTVAFDALGESRTRLRLEMSFAPDGFVETVGEALGFASRRVDGDLQHFKEYLERRGSRRN